MSAGGSAGSGSSKFARNGTVNTNSWRELTGSQNSQFNDSLQALHPGQSDAATSNMLTQQVTKGWGDIPYSDAMCQLVSANMPGVKTPGQDNLNVQANVNPYSADYTDNTYGRYADEVSRLMSVAKSGPQMTRGGTAAQGFAMSDAMNQAALNREDVLAKHRQSDAAISQGAAQQLANARQNQHQTAMSGANSAWGGYYNMTGDQQKAGQISNDRTKMFNELLTGYSGLSSITRGQEVNQLSGHGAQTNSSVGAGFNVCCFIFMESLGQELPECVRRYRDEFAPECSARRTGYIRMSKWLVPAMRVNKVVRKVVNGLMIRPLTSYAKWFYGGKGMGWVFKPVRNFWFTIWKLTGK